MMSIVDEILLASNLPVETLPDGTVLPVLHVAQYVPEDPDEPCGGGWINCRWGSHDCGGAWISGGEVLPYAHGDMTGVDPLTIDDMRAMGLALDECEIEIIITRIQRASVRRTHAELRARALSV